MDRHRDCHGLVSGYTLPQGYDDEGALPDERVYVCHRCGNWLSDAEMYEPDDVDEGEGG